MDFAGLHVVSSPYAPKGTIYIIDAAALELPPVSELFTEPRPVAVNDSMYLRLGMEIAFRGPTQVERDPLGAYVPHTFLGVWRLMRDVWGYEWRKATGRLRRYPKAQHAIITGLTC